MVVSQRQFGNDQGSSVQRFSFAQATLARIELRKVAEQDAHVRMPGLQSLLRNGQCPSVERLGFVVSARDLKQSSQIEQRGVHKTMVGPERSAMVRPRRYSGSALAGWPRL